MNNSLEKFNFENLFILDLANNHKGSLELGRKIVAEFAKVAKDEGAQAAIKFQLRDLDILIHPDHKNDSKFPYIGYFQKNSLKADDYKILAEDIRSAGLVTMATPFDEPSVDLIVKLGIQVIKVASASASDWPLLEKIASAGKPVVCSTGGLKIHEVDNLVSFFEHRNVHFALLHCVAIYPTPQEKLNLGQIAEFKRRYPEITIGFSTHEDPNNLEAVKVAYALGARVFERHIGVETADAKLNAYSSTPEQIRAWIRARYQAVSMAALPSAQDEETETLSQFQRGVYAARAIAKGSLIKSEDVMFAIPLLPGQLSSGNLKKSVADRDYAAGEAIMQAAKNNAVSKKDIIYKAVHDVKAMLKMAKIEMNNDSEVELSHHHGIERFAEVGATIIDCVNREYCKKILVLLPGQTHPGHYHQKKEDKVTEFKRKIVIPDFSIETAIEHTDDICEIKVPTQKWDLLLRDISRQLYKVKGAFNSEVSFHFEKSDYYHVDTEGRILVHQNPYFLLDLEVEGRGVDKEGHDDGTNVKARKKYYTRNLESMPSKEKVLDDSKSLKKELTALRRAPMLVELRERRPTVCPAILHPGMLGTYIHEALGHRLEPIRKGYKEISNIPLDGLMGHQIMPAFLSIDFDPTITEFPKGSGQIPNGHYKFDAEGIKAKRVAIIEKGKLVNYLTTRTPVYDSVSGKRFLKSNGHARLEGLIDGEGNAIDPIARMSTMHIISEKKVSYDTLKKMAAEECKKQGLEYYVELEVGHEGYTITEGEDGMFGIDMGKEMQFSYSKPYKTFLVDASNGKRTLIREVGMIKIPFEALQSIMATDNNYELSNGQCGSTSGWVHVSEISPKALVKQVTLVPIETRDSPFILPPP